MSMSLCFKFHNSFYLIKLVNNRVILLKALNLLIVIIDVILLLKCLYAFCRSDFIICIF